MRVGTSKFLLLKEINKGLLIACRYKLSRPMKNRQTSTASFATKPTRSRPTHPFLGAALLQRHFRVRWRARLPPPRILLPHTYMQDGWFLQPERRPARLPRRTVFSRCIRRSSRMRVRLPLHILLATHMDICLCGAWFRFGSGFGIGCTLRTARSFTRSPFSRHPPFTQYPFPPRSLVCGGQAGWGLVQFLL